MKHKQPSYSLTTIRAIIGLGNPGNKYYKTRHSIGFRVVDELVTITGASLQTTHEMEYALTCLPSTDAGDNSRPVHLIKPTTFMNDSGRVMPWLTKKGIAPEEVIVIHDELEKPFGYVGMKFDGSAKGHNGLRSIIERVGKGFWRLRVGIGRPERKEEVGNYVLQPFSQQEEVDMPVIIENAVQKILAQ